MLPTWPTNQRVSSPVKGARCAEIPSGPAAAICCQRPASFDPTSGTSATHAGGCGTVSVAADLDQSAIWVTLFTTVAMPR